MSLAARRLSLALRLHCPCGKRSFFRLRRGGVAARSDHPLCPRCWRSERDRMGALTRNAFVRARVVLPPGIVLVG
jgi:hypothetical protein